VGRSTTDTLLYKTLVEPTMSTIYNNGILTLPSTSDTIIARNTTDTITNKTLITPIISSIYPNNSSSNLLTFPNINDTVTTANVN
jgi:hypothetical protein